MTTTRPDALRIKGRQNKPKQKDKVTDKTAKQDDKPGGFRQLISSPLQPIGV
jgi:hypothetical protein